MSDYLTLPLKKSVLLSRAAAMTAKAAETVGSADGEQAKRIALSQRITNSPQDTMLLVSALRSAVDSFFVFIAGEAFGIQHIADTLSDDSDDFMIEMDRPPRFNEAMRQPLVSQVADFIVRSILVSWYSAFSTEVAEQHAALLPNIQFSIARCFRKVDVTPLSGLFPTEIKIDTSAIPTIVCSGDAFPIPYTISGSAPHPINDIELVSTDPLEKIAKCEIFSDHIQVYCVSDGSVDILLQSHHNDSVSDSFTLTITPYV